VALWAQGLAPPAACPSLLIFAKIFPHRGNRTRDLPLDKEEALPLELLAFCVYG